MLVRMLQLQLEGYHYRKTINSVLPEVLEINVHKDEVVQ